MTQNNAMAPLRQIQKNLNSGNQRFQIEVLVSGRWIPLNITPRYNFQGDAIESAIEQHKKFPLVYVKVRDLLWDRLNPIRPTSTVFRSWNPKKKYIPE